MNVDAKEIWVECNKKMNLERKVCFVIRIKLSGLLRNGFVRIEIEIANDDPIVFRVSRLPRNAKKMKHSSGYARIDV